MSGAPTRAICRGTVSKAHERESEQPLTNLGRYRCSRGYCWRSCSLSCASWSGISPPTSSLVT